jgi:hypothetical protein
MPPKSKIIKLGLEPRTIELYNIQKPLAEIAETLSNESNDNITKSMVFEYLKSDARYKAEAIEKKAELAIKVAEVEISTIEDRQTIIRGLLALATIAEEARDRVLAYKEANVALDSLDKRIGKLTNIGIHIDNSKTENTVNVVLHLPRKDPLPGIR